MTLRRRRATDCKPRCRIIKRDQARQVLQPVVPARNTQARHRETGRVRFQNGFNLSEKASLVNFPTHTMPWWSNLRLIQKKMNLMTQGQAPKRVNRSSLLFFFLHIFFENIRIVRFAGSRKQPELRAGIALKREETESIFYKKGVML